MKGTQSSPQKEEHAKGQHGHTHPQVDVDSDAFAMAASDASNPATVR
jgi:hypothetical protein